MPYLSTSAYTEQQASTSFSAWLSRWSLLVAMALPLSACDVEPAKDKKDDSSEEDDDDDSEGDDNSKSKEDDGDDDNSSTGGDNKGSTSDDDSASTTGTTGGKEDTTSSTDDGKTDSTKDGKDGKDGKDDERDCSKIKWGSKLVEGGIIPKSDNQGFVDSDGDHKAEDKETEVGMCALHKLKAKCGLIISGWYG